MGDLSEHFNRSEFSCHCGCGFDKVHPELINVLEDLRVKFSKPITINSGCRCEKHNATVGGEPGSQHMLGTAADIVVKDTPTDVVYAYLDSKYPMKYGLGLYKSWVHVDVRSRKARWKK